MSRVWVRFPMFFENAQGAVVSFVYILHARFVYTCVVFVL